MTDASTDTRSVEPAPAAGCFVSDQDMAEVMRTAIRKAKDGDNECIGIVERHWSRHDRPVVLDLPEVVDAASLAEAQRRVISATAKGRITPRQGHSFATLLEYRRRALDTIEFEKRLTEIERKRSDADALRAKLLQSLTA